MKFQIKTWTIPIALLIICGLGFGLLIPLLGFFWDDWPAIATIRLLGVDAFWNFYKGERPLSAWTFILFGPLFGTNQLLWHSFTLLMRWLTVLGMWWSLKLLWPKRRTEVTWMAFLFAIYPTFTQQPVAVAFSQHWITYCLYFSSIALMLLTVRKPRAYLPLTILAMAMSALHMLTMEYFIASSFYDHCSCGSSPQYKAPVPDSAYKRPCSAGCHILCFGLASSSGACSSCKLSL